MRRPWPTGGFGARVRKRYQKMHITKFKLRLISIHIEPLHVSANHVAIFRDIKYES